MSDALRKLPVHRLKRLLNATDPELAAHGARAATLAADIATEMRLDPNAVDRLMVAAQLHDVGKVFISREILDKPGPLTEEQWVELRRHPQMGYELVRDRVPSEVAQIVLTHHERFDGTGYPNAIAGLAVPLEARVLQVADAFDAITSDRPYQQALSVEYALEEIVRCAGSQFDPSVVEGLAALAGRTAWLRTSTVSDPLAIEIAV